ncbi:MAG: biotin--[acetyl-CoA-carboxylase] ligase [Acidobacteriales bacterium]|nr:biotin--[acetyl-CoA-carboxylase] ligase [Terriglobales bacterium]
MADEIGVSRSAVWRMVQQLRALSVNITGHPTTGYTLAKVPDLLLPEYLATQLKGTMFSGKIHHYFRIDSTNAAAIEAAASGEPEGSLFVAEEQTAGRGRGGNSWLSEKSAGIYCSVILRPQLPPADVLALSLLAGLVVQQAARQVTRLRADLRWPNDLLLSEKKFCGILAEMNAEPTRVRYAVLGIGMNVNHKDFPADLRDSATSLRIESGQEWPRIELLTALLQSLDREYRALSADSVKNILHRFEQNSSYARRKQVRVEENGGFEGVTDGLDARGFLRVRTADGMRTVFSGGVRPVSKD